MKEESSGTATLRTTSRAFLEGKLSRRAFVSELMQLGVASSTAGKLANRLQPTTAAAAHQQGPELSELTGGEIMAEFLLDRKIPYVFGLGGSEEVGFLDALVDRLGLHYVLALHEGSAMSMADGYARTSGTTAFLNLHSVAGTGYALGPMVNAFKDWTPIVVTVGRQGSLVQGSQAFLEATNLHLLPRDYARWTWDVTRAETIAETLRRAFLLARVPPGGPTFVTFAKDLWEERVKSTHLIPDLRSPVEDEFRPADDQIRHLVDRLLEAESPLLIAGRELSLHGGAAELSQIAELLGIPVMGDVPASHSPLSFPTTHPQYCGLFTMEQNFPQEMDLFWSVGGTMFTLFERPDRPLVPEATAVVHSSIDASQIGRNYPVDLAVTGHSRTILKAVLAEIQTRDLSATRFEMRRRAAVAYHHHRKERLERLARNLWEGSPVPPERLAAALNQHLLPDAIVVTELVTSDLFVWQHLDFQQATPGRLHITSAGGCLGWGTGAAIGAKIGAPNRPVALLVGDGSFQFGIQALWTASRYEVPVAFIVWNNSAYQANGRALHNYGGRAAETGKYVGCYLGEPSIDYVALAKGYGIEAEQVVDTNRLDSAIRNCLQVVESGRSFVLDVAVEPRFGGADSKWYDFFSVARAQARRS